MNQEKALRRVQEGQPDGLAWFVEQYSAYVSTIVYNIIGKQMTASDVEEVTSDVFYAFWRNAHKTTPPQVRAYLGAIARSHAKNKLRKAGFDMPFEEEFYISEDLTLEDQLLEKELQKVTRQTVRAMKEPEREIVLRYYYYGQSIALISREMGLTQTNIKVKLHRARNLLRQKLTDYLQEGGNEYGISHCGFV